MKRQLVALVMTLAIAVAGVPQVVSAETVVMPQQTTAATVSPSPTPVSGPDLVAKYCDLGFKKLKDRVFLIPKNGKSSYASNNLTDDKSFATLIEDPIYITIKKLGGCSVKVSFSDPSVASCSVSTERDRKSRETYYEIGDIKSKKAGKTKMTISVRVGNSVREFSCNLTFQKYQENPVNSFKLDKKNFSSAFSPQKVKVLASGEIPRPTEAKKQRLKLKKKQTKVKINVKLKKGYKLKNIWKGDGMYRKVKNGGYYKLASYEKKEFWVYIEYVDKSNSVRSLCLPVKITRK